MLSFGKDQAAELRTRIKQKIDMANDYAVKKLQQKLLPDPRRSDEELQQTRAYLETSIKQTFDMTNQFAKVLSYIALAILSLYALSAVSNILTPGLELFAEIAALLSATVVGANVIYLMPTYVKLKLEDLEIAAKKTETTVTIEEEEEEEVKEAPANVDELAANNKLDSDSDDEQELDEDVTAAPVITPSKTRHRRSDSSIVMVDKNEVPGVVDDNNADAKPPRTGSTSPKPNPMTGS